MEGHCKQLAAILAAAGERRKMQAYRAARFVDVLLTHHTIESNAESRRNVLTKVSRAQF